MKKPIPRRSFLRSAVATIALPWLDAMTPSRARAQGAAGPKRLVNYFFPNGTVMGEWKPTEPGTLRREILRPCLVDLAGYADQPSVLADVNVVTGLDHRNVARGAHEGALFAAAYGDGKDGYQRPVRATFDQFAAERLAPPTAFPSLVVSADSAFIPEASFISWQDEIRQVEPYRDASRLFDAIFASSDESPEMRRLRERRQSILDFAKEDAARLKNVLGAADRRRLDEHLDSIRQLERQTTGAACTRPAAPGDTSNHHTRAKVMVDLLVMAMKCDRTRIVSFQYANAIGNFNYNGMNLPGIRDGLGDHTISHATNGDGDRSLHAEHGDRAWEVAVQRIVAVTQFKIKQFVYFLNEMKKVQEGEHDLLYNSIVYYSSEIANGYSHTNHDKPILVAGNAGGALSTGRHLVYTERWQSDLFCSILNYLGVEVDRYGDQSRGPLPGF